MKKSLLLVIILTIFVFVPAIVGAALNGKGTGIFVLDLILFALVPIIIFSLLLHFLFKFPSEVSAPAKVHASAKAASKAKAKEKAAEPEELTAVEPVSAGEPEVTCPECGGVVTMFDVNCPHCGVKFEGGETATAETVEAEQPVEQPIEQSLEEPVEALEPLEAPVEVIKPSEQPEAPPGMIDFGLKCPTCGGNVGLEEKFCPHCGADFEQKEAAEEGGESDKTEEELDKLFGIAPEEAKPEPQPAEPKPTPQAPEDITISYEEPEAEQPVKNKKGKKRR